MSVDYSSKAVLGYKVDTKQLKAMTSKKVRCCKHPLPEKGKFCPECGAKLWEEESAEPYDLAKSVGLSIETAGTEEDEDVIFADKTISIDDYSKSKVAKIPSMQPGNSDDEEAGIADAQKERVKASIEKIGLVWQEENYGWWLVHYCSY